MQAKTARVGVLIAILVSVTVLGAWQYQLLRLNFLIGNRSIDKEGTPLAAMQHADQITDPFSRCLAYPQPTGIEWPEAMIEAFCADELTPVPDYWSVFNRIDEGRGSEVDVMFNSIVDAYFEGRLPEGTLWKAYNYHFSNDDEETRRMLRDWLEQSPDSAHAKVAQGLHYLLVGEAARGGKVASETTAADISRMKTYMRRAIDDLESGLARDPRLLPAYSSLISAAKYTGDEQLADSAYKRALAVDPKSFYIRAARAFSMEPRWGGSYERMLSVAEDGNSYTANNPRMPNLFAIAYGTMGHDVYFYNDDPSDHEAMSYFEQALNHGPVYRYLRFAADTAEDLGDHSRAVQFYSQVLRFSPNAARVRRNRARAISRVGMHDWAISEFRQVLSQTPNDESAVRWYAWLLTRKGDHTAAARYYEQLISLDPDDQETRRRLARIYLYKLQKFDLAAPLINKLLEDDPESGANWLLKADFLSDTNRPGVESSIKNFLKYADESDPEQRAAIPKVKKWLLDSDRSTP